MYFKLQSSASRFVFFKTLQVIDSNGYGAYRTSYGSAIADYVATENVVYIRQKTVAGHVGIDFRASWGTAPISKSLCLSTDSAICKSLSFY